MKKYLYTPLILVALITVFVIAGVHVNIAHAQTVAPCTNGAPGSNFVCLTAIPGLGNLTSSNPNFIAFFNNLYKICIGLAASLALIEIIWAGVTWMTAGDSTEKVGEARKRIANAVFGLLLVLSPVIVFGIINPNVLSLNLNVTPLAPSAQAPAAATGAAGAPAVGSTIPAVNGACPANSTPITGTTNCTVTSSTANPNGAPAGGTCTTAPNDPGCAGNLICTNGTCQADPELDNGTGAAGQACQPSAPNCASGLTCDGTDTCNPPATAAPPPASTAAVPADGDTGS